MAEIYMLANKLTGKMYVGKTSQGIENRKETHFSNARKGLNTYLYKAIRKYGEDSFELVLLECCVDESVVDERERFWIAEKDCKIPNGYNMTGGGEGGDTSKSPNYIEGMKRRNTSGENNSMFGKPSAMLGKKHRRESKEKQSQARKRFWEDEERKKHMSAKLSGNRNPMFGKKPPNSLQVEVDGVLYGSITEASRSLGITPYKVKKIGRLIHER